jgi:hypothetical protein
MGSMSAVFSFFLRLFLCFVAARFFLQAIEVEGRNYLVGLTIVLLVNVYWFSYLVFRDRTASRIKVTRGQSEGPAGPGAETGEPSDNQASSR